MRYATLKEVTTLVTQLEKRIEELEKKVSTPKIKKEDRTFKTVPKN